MDAVEQSDIGPELEEGSAPERNMGIFCIRL